MQVTTFYSVLNKSKESTTKSDILCFYVCLLSLGDFFPPVFMILQVNIINLITLTSNSTPLSNKAQD